MYIILYAGANGAGKSTIVDILNEELNLPFINPDMIAREYFSHVADEIERYTQYAMPLAEKLRKELVMHGKDFSFETVLSNPSKIDFLYTAKDQGYDIYSLFIGTSDPSINIGRVKNRVAKGGHDVPKDKIIERYYRVMKNLPELLNLSEEAVVLDNSGNRIIPILYKSSQGNYYLLDNKENCDIPEWINEYIINPMRQSGYLKENPSFLDIELEEGSLFGLVKTATEKVVQNNSNMKQGIDEWKREISEVRRGEVNKESIDVTAPIKGPKDEQEK